jgi:hypothetical protein
MRLVAGILLTAAGVAGLTAIAVPWLSGALGYETVGLSLGSRGLFGVGLLGFASGVCATTGIFVLWSRSGSRDLN